ncbi:MAG: ArnT family glycosyltransferase [Acetobacteraceae bacterium]
MHGSVPGFRRPARLAAPLAALAALTAVRLVMAAVIPLSPDEAYYWVWSRIPQAGYPDHPPMVAWWIRFGTWILGATPLGVRLAGPISGVLGTVLLYQAAEWLWPGRRAGLTAALLLNATLMLGIGTVVMTPDTPLLFFWIACLWALAGFVRDQNGWWLVLAAVAAGAAFDSKYTAAFLALGAVAWLTLVPAYRRFWRTAAPYWALMFGMQAVAPVIRWNQDHHWVSFLRQGGRLTHWHPADAPRLLVQLLAAQAGLATPVIALLFVAGLVWAARLTWRVRDPAATLLAAMSLPAALVFVQHCFAGRVQGNWPDILYPGAALAAAARDGRWRRLVVPGAVVGLAITALVYAQAASGFLPIPPARDPTSFRLAGWGGLARRAEAMARAHGAGYLAATDYDVAGELAFHLPRGVRLVGAEPRWGYFALPRPVAGMGTGLLVRSLRRAGPPRAAPWASVRVLGVIWRRRGRELVEGYRTYLVTLRPGATAVLLPRGGFAGTGGAPPG